MPRMRTKSFLIAAFAALSAALVAQEQPVRIHAATILDGTGKVLRNATIVVHGSKIAAIETGASGTASYELGRLTVIPGMIDVHSHLGWHFGKDGRSNEGENETPQELVLFAAENGWRTLMGGVTTVQSLGAAVDKPLRDAFARGVLPGPRVLTAIEPISDPKLTPDQMREAVRKIAADGADVVKVFASQSIRNGGAPTMSQEQMNAICAEAKAHGLRVAVHAHGPESVQRSILAGATSIEHGVLIGQPELDLMAAHGTYFDPNIDLVFRNYFENKEHFLGIANYTEEGFAKMREAVPKALNVFQMGLKTKGLKMVFGTDAVAGAHGRNFQELVYRVQRGGQSPMDAITSATSLAAESLGLGDRVGSIAPGYEADLIALDGDPLQDITALGRVSFVMKGGHVYKQ